MGGDFHAPKLELVLFEIDNGLNLIVEDVTIALWTRPAQVPLKPAQQYDVFKILNKWITYTLGSSNTPLQEKISARRIAAAIVSPLNLKLEVQVTNYGTSNSTAKFDLQSGGVSLIEGPVKVTAERRHGVSASYLYYATLDEGSYTITPIGNWKCAAPMVGFVP